MIRTGTTAVLAATIVFCGMSGALARGERVIDDRLVALLNRAVTSPLAPRGSDAGLAALRRLRDPALQPLFGRLASSSSPILRRHGVLGLAELETPPRLRPVLLTKIESPAERAFILGEAIGEGLLKTSDAEAMLGAGGLEPFLEVVLIGLVRASDRPSGVERLRELAQDNSALVACPALLLLCSAGESGAGDRLVERLAALSPADRGAAMGILFQQAQRDRLTGCGTAMGRVYELVKGDPVVALDALRAWMTVDSAGASTSWREAYTGATDLSSRLRFALVGLESSSGAPPSAFSDMAEDPSPLVRAIGALATAVASDDGIEEAVAAAAAHSYPPLEAWLVERLAVLNQAEAQEAWRAIVRSGAARPPSQPVTEGVAAAAERLAPVDGSFMKEQLRAAAEKRDTVLCQALLTGMLRATPAPEWESASIAEWPDRVTGALALVVAARSDPDFAGDPDRVARLTSAAVGRSGLPEAIRIEAAWLAARVQGQEAEAIAGVAADLDH